MARTRRAPGCATRIRGEPQSCPGPSGPAKLQHQILWRSQPGVAASGSLHVGGEVVRLEGTGRTGQMERSEQSGWSPGSGEREGCTPRAPAALPHAARFARCTPRTMHASHAARLARCSLARCTPRTLYASRAQLRHAYQLHGPTAQAAGYKFMAPPFFYYSLSTLCLVAG